MDMISLIIPCYNEEAAIPLFYRAVDEVSRKMAGVSFEFLFVDDGSSDATPAVLKGLREADARVAYLSFSRNFGKEAAMVAGLQHAAGDFVAVMDVDLQDPPALLPQMYERLRQGGCDAVAACRVTREKEPFIRSLFSRMFYRMVNVVSKTKIVNGARDYRLMTRRMVDAILALGEYNRFSKGIFSWVGFQTEWLPYRNVSRSAGKTKWSFWKLVLYSLDGMTAFSTLPLAISSVCGLLFCIVSFVMILVFIIKTVLFSDPVSGYPSLVCIIFFLGGIQLFCIGILGQYLSKIYMEVKRRPLYILKDTDGIRRAPRENEPASTRGV